jgi:uncharacterized protein HemX
MNGTAEVKAFVEKLADWVKSQGPKQQSRSGTSGLIVGALVAGVAMLTLAFMQWRSWRQGQKLAALEHERDVQNQKAEMAKALAKVKDNEAAITDLTYEAAKADERIAAIDAEMKQTDDAKVRTLDEIEKIKSWRDVDRYLAGEPPTAPPEPR